MRLLQPLSLVSALQTGWSTLNLHMRTQSGEDTNATRLSDCSVFANHVKPAGIGDNHPPAAYLFGAGRSWRTTAVAKT